MIQRLRDRRERILRAALVAMIPAVALGCCGFIFAFIPDLTGSQAPKQIVFRDGLMTGLNTAAVVFWAVFLFRSMIEMTKSHAVLELERRVKYAEELFERARAVR